MVERMVYSSVSRSVAQRAAWKAANLVHWMAPSWAVDSVLQPAAQMGDNSAVARGDLKVVMWADR